MALTVKMGSEKSSQKGFLQGGFPKVLERPFVECHPLGARPLKSSQKSLNLCVSWALIHRPHLPPTPSGRRRLLLGCSLDMQESYPLFFSIRSIERRDSSVGKVDTCFCSLCWPLVRKICAHKNIIGTPPPPKTPP